MDVSPKTHFLTRINFNPSIDFEVGDKYSSMLKLQRLLQLYKQFQLTYFRAI